MSEPQVAPYGSWKSPITAEMVAAGTMRLEQIALDGEDVYWTETRPTEGGRSVVVRRTADGRGSDVTPPPFNARTRVHEYGGGAFAVADGTVYFSNFDDQRLYRQDAGVEPRPITPEGVDLRYADGVIDRRRNRMICVREDHTVAGREAVTTLVCVALNGDESGGQVLVAENDFYSSPRLSPDGSRLAWLTWNHPNMPWDGTELWVAEVKDDGSLDEAVHVAGGKEESIFQPEWSPDGVLHFISDRTGWWNLYRWRPPLAPPCQGGVGGAELLCPMEAEFGRPQWGFAMSTYSFESANRIVCAFKERGGWRLAILDTATLQLQRVEIPYTEITSVRAQSGRVVLMAAAPTEPMSAVELELGTAQSPFPTEGTAQSPFPTILRRSAEIAVDEGYLSTPQPIEFPTENGLTAYGYFYPPHNRNFVAPEGEKPPLLVMSHGGPTSATSSALRLAIQFWTSRGIAVLDVNYSGSTGYGRAYRQRLNGQWGVVDVDDCANGARYLVEQGLVDVHRLAITGGSAGGYTTLCALTFRNVFKAGASHFGVSDLESLAKETHKFESRYLDNLIGPYPERRDLYVERSPINFTEHLSCPAIFFQGLEDEVVPPNQSERMFNALRAKGIPTAYLAFEGEQHGFRRAENIQRALEAELYFYAKVLGFELADEVEPVAIENLRDSIRE